MSEPGEAAAAADSESEEEMPPRVKAFYGLFNELYHGRLPDALGADAYLAFNAFLKETVYDREQMAFAIRLLDDSVADDPLCCWVSYQVKGMVWDKITFEADCVFLDGEDEDLSIALQTPEELTDVQIFEHHCPFEITKT